jgi:hypothetical protein
VADIGESKARSHVEIIAVLLLIMILVKMIFS